jgi:serine/threonine-protein kinase RsbW
MAVFVVVMLCRSLSWQRRYQSSLARIELDSGSRWEGVGVLNEVQMEEAKKRRLEAVLDNVPVAIDFVTEAARPADLDERTLYQVQLAVDEACANVVNHAYQGMEPGEMEIVCSLDDFGLSIRIRDWGSGFEVDEVSDPDVDAPLEERILGGLGLYLIRQVMDLVEYRRGSEGCNELVMTKRLHDAEQ